jgi:hypothetical protein
MTDREKIVAEIERIMGVGEEEFYQNREYYHALQDIKDFILKIPSQENADRRYIGRDECNG